MKYRARVIFRMPVGPNEGSGLWGAPSRMGMLVSDAVRGWVIWEGSLSEVFHGNMVKR